jgi:hypothetical protein
MKDVRSSGEPQPWSGFLSVYLPWLELSVNFGHLFTHYNSFIFIAKPAPKTMTPEYQEATKQYMLEQNANPIRGISSQKARAADKQED